MIYSAVKAIHNVTSGIALLLFLASAFTSDFHVVEMGQKEPESVRALITWGAILMIPTVIYLILEYIKERYINVQNR